MWTESEWIGDHRRGFSSHKHDDSTSIQLHRQQKKKTKTTLTTQRVKSSKGTVTKARQKRSLPSTRRLNLASNQLASVVRPRRSIIGSNQSHRKSIPHLSENSKISMLFNSMKQQEKTKSTHSTVSSKTRGERKWRAWISKSPHLLEIVMLSESFTCRNEEACSPFDEIHNQRNRSMQIETTSQS